MFDIKIDSFLVKKQYLLATYKLCFLERLNKSLKICRKQLSLKNDTV